MNEVNEMSLIEAIENNDVERIKLFIHDGADVNGTGATVVNGRTIFATPLHVAVKNGNLEIISCLIVAGADVNAHNSLNETPFYSYAKNEYNFGHSDMGKGVLSLLFASGAEIPGNLIDWAKAFLKEDTVQFIKVSEYKSKYVENCIISIYRQADVKGNPMLTSQESEYKNERFKFHASPLVALSLFREHQGLTDCMISGNLIGYLNNNEIKNASEVSKIEDDAGTVLNSSLLKEAGNKSNENILEFISSSMRKI